MSDLRKAAEQALEALEYDFNDDPRYAATGNIESLRKRYALIEVLRAALAEPDDVANITLRDHLAGQALMGLLASRNPNTPRFHPTDDAQYVYAVADAMLKARESKS